MKYCIERCVPIHNSKLADFEKQWHVLVKHLIPVYMFTFYMLY